jgi:hypothetical protein
MRIILQKRSTWTTWTYGISWTHPKTQDQRKGAQQDTKQERTQEQKRKGYHYKLFHCKLISQQPLCTNHMKTIHDKKRICEHWTPMEVNFFIAIIKPQLFAESNIGWYKIINYIKGWQYYKVLRSFDSKQTQKWALFLSKKSSAHFIEYEIIIVYK